MTQTNDVISLKVNQLEASLLKVDQALEKQSEVLRELTDAVIRLGNIQSSLDRVETTVNTLVKSNADLQREVDRLMIKSHEMDKIWTEVDKLKEQSSATKPVITTVKWLATAIGGIVVMMAMNHLF